MYKSQIDAAIAEAEKAGVYFTPCRWVYPKCENKQRLLPLFNSQGQFIHR
jgi:hypothetical protein